MIVWILSRWFAAILLAFIASSSVVLAQSQDINAPNPVRGFEVNGQIAARDIGDARFTNHYYTFVGNPGDLMITVEARNLNGDIDVFTTTGLRPLLKFSIYAESIAPVAKGVFLRKRENLILRVEARSPNDDQGTYQIRFGGSFEPIVGGEFLAEAEKPAEETTASSVTSSGRKIRRVTSAGEIIYEPEPPPAEVAAAPTPEPTPAPVVEEKSEPSKETVAEAPKETPPRSTRTRRPANRRGRNRPPAEPPATVEKEATAATETAETKTAETKTEETKTEEATARRSSSRRGSNRRTRQPEPTPPAETAPQEETGPRLILETSDGTLINRSMSTVRRVMVENNQVVVVGKDGQVIRVQLSKVVRMSIEPGN